MPRRRTKGGGGLSISAAPRPGNKNWSSGSSHLVGLPTPAFCSPTLTRQFWNSSEALGPPQSPAPLSWLSPAGTSHVLSPGSRPGCHQPRGGGAGTLAPRHSGPVWGKQRQVRSAMALEPALPWKHVFQITTNYSEEGVGK